MTYSGKEKKANDQEGAKYFFLLTGVCPLDNNYWKKIRVQIVFLFAI